MRGRFKGILGFLLIVIFLTIGLCIFYYVFFGDIKQGTDISISGGLSINYKSGSKLSIKNKKEVKVSVINSSDTDSYFYIEFINPHNVTKKVEYEVSDGKNFNVKDTLNNYNTIVSSYILIGPGEEQVYTFSFNAKSNLRYKVEINIEEESLDKNIFSEVILKNNKIKEKPVTQVSGAIATTDEGLIAETDDYGTSYYFRGNVLNNNVKINDKMFKIVKINGDGSVKLVYNGLTSEARKYYDNKDNISFSSSAMKTYLENWLLETLGSYASLVSTQKYCNDNTIKEGNFLAYSRVVQDHISSYVCLGDRVLSKVGLLTVDEAVHAGGMVDTENTSYYLYNPDITESYYLMTGAKYDENNYYPFSINGSGAINTNDSGSNLMKIRPVININKIVSVTGTGFIEDPYVLTSE